MSKLRCVSHVIFDLDGLLLDSESIYIKMFTAIAAQYKKEYPLEVRMKLMGTVERDSAVIMCEDLKLPITPDEFLDQQHERQILLLPTAPLMQGAERLVRHLHTKKVPFALATSSSKESLDLKISKHKELFDLFHHMVCGSSDPEVKKGKPAPDIFQVCAARFPDNPLTSRILVFEDAPNGVMAAVAAGMQVVMVPDETVSEDKRQAATMVLKSLEDFKPELFGLPPF